MNDLQFMPHQEEVLNLTDDKNRCAYYLDMGLGKTFVGAEKMYLLNNTVNLIVCQKSKIDDWVDHMKTYYPEYRVMDLTKKSEGVNFRTLVETKDLYDQNIQIVGVINYDLVFRRKYIAHITDFTLLLAVMVKDFAKKDDLMDFFEGVAELVGTEQNDSMNAATVDMVTPTAI